VHNIRLFQNRGVSAAHNGYSAQPMFGGPVYFYRNLLYHVGNGSAFKLSDSGGLRMYHNTLINEQRLRPVLNALAQQRSWAGRRTAAS
jgi:hypothetical protein